MYSYHNRYSTGGISQVRVVELDITIEGYVIGQVKLELCQLVRLSLCQLGCVSYSELVWLTELNITIEGQS